MLRQNRTFAGNTLTELSAAIPLFTCTFPSTVDMTICNTGVAATQINIAYAPADSANGSTVRWYQNHPMALNETMSSLHISLETGDRIWVFQTPVAGAAPSILDITFMSLGVDL